MLILRLNLAILDFYIQPKKPAFFIFGKVFFQKTNKKRFFSPKKAGFFSKLFYPYFSLKVTLSSRFTLIPKISIALPKTTFIFDCDVILRCEAERSNSWSESEEKGYFNPLPPSDAVRKKKIRGSF